LGWLLFLRQNVKQAPQKNYTWIDLDTDLSKSAARKNKEEKKTKRIVQTEKGTKVDTASADAYLGPRNQTVDRQTVSKNKTTTVPSSTKASLTKKEKVESESLKSLSKFGLKLPNPKSLSEREKDSEWRSGSPAQDYLDGLPESDRTALNTQEFKYYGYYQRIRVQLDRAWVPILRSKLVVFLRSGRYLNSSVDHNTRVLVILNDQGAIKKVQIVDESGIQDLDDAAIRAFHQAGPFPNPPRDMVDLNKEVKIPWNFVLKS
jgi:TonB family protein